jgi:hypothetical protein
MGGNMENVGQLLKERRTQLNKSFDEIHAQTRIIVEHLQLLEENNFTFLPETYIKSFLKTYANDLGLGGDEILRKYNQNKQERKSEEDEVSRIQEEKAQSAHPMNRVLELGLAAGAFLLLIFIVLVYLQYRSEIYARPLDHKNGRLNKLQYENVGAAHHHSAGATITTKSFLLNITGLENVDIQLDVTGAHQFRERDTDRPATITAVERFDIVIDQRRGINLKFDDLELADLGIGSGNLRLSIVRGGGR